MLLESFLLLSSVFTTNPEKPHADKTDEFLEFLVPENQENEPITWYEFKEKVSQISKQIYDHHVSFSKVVIGLQKSISSTKDKKELFKEEFFLILLINCDIITNFEKTSVDISKILSSNLNYLGNITERKELFPLIMSKLECIKASYEKINYLRNIYFTYKLEYQEIKRYFELGGGYRISYGVLQNLMLTFHTNSKIRERLNLPKESK